MSFSFFGYTGKAIRVLSAVLVVLAFVGISSVNAQAASISQVNDQIATAKAKLFGEYPKVETAWPEVIRPEAPVVKTTTEKTEATATVAAKTEVAKEVAPVEVKTEAPKAEPTPAATVEAAAVTAPAPVATEAPAAIESTGDTWVDEILRLVNENRAAEGLSALTINSKAQEAAAIRVAELPNSPSPHLRPDGAQFYTVFAEVGLKPKTGGENYAIGTANAYSPEAIVNAWMNSPGHRKNIMNSTYKQIGIGHAIIGDKEYFEQLFIG